MVDPLSYFPFQPVLHECGNKDCGMCYPIYGMVHINCAKFLSLKCAHISLWLNSMGHSKLHSTLNTLHLLPTLVRLLVLPCTHHCRRSPLTPSPFFFLTQTEELACDRHVPQQLVWMCTLNTLTWPDFSQTGPMVQWQSHQLLGW